jgi:hypothetical protein
MQGIQTELNVTKLNVTKLNVTELNVTELNVAISTSGSLTLSISTVYWINISVCVGVHSF